MKKNQLIGVVISLCMTLPLTACYANGAVCYFMQEAAPKLTTADDDDRLNSQNERNNQDYAESYPHESESELSVKPSFDVYGYGLLNSRQQYVFDVMWQDALTIGGNVKIDTVDLDRYALPFKEWYEVQQLYRVNEPLYEFFDFGYRANGAGTTREGMVTTVEKYGITYARDEDAARPAVIREKIKEIIAGIPQETTDDQKLLYLAEYLCDTVVYGEKAEEKYSQQHGEFTVLGEFNPSHTCYGALILGEAVCDGYAQSFLLLAREIGIPAIIVHSDSHAWNMVNLDGIWYHVDVTWMDTGENGSYDPAYFLGSDTDFQDHMDAAGVFYYTDYFEAPKASNARKLNGLLLQNI